MSEANERLQKAADECYYRNHAFARESFIEGANWQRNSVWHDVSELPNNGSRIIVIGKTGDVFSCTHVAGGKYKAYWDLYDLNECRKWCYVDDLLPSRNEE